MRLEKCALATAVAAQPSHMPDTKPGSSAGARSIAIRPDVTSPERAPAERAGRLDEAFARIIADPYVALRTSNVINSQE